MPVACRTTAPSDADCSRASRRSAASGRETVSAFSVSWRPSAPENPTLPSTIIWNISRSFTKPNRSGNPRVSPPTRSAKKKRFWGAFFHRSLAPRHEGTSMPLPPMLVMVQNGSRWQLAHCFVLWNSLMPARARAVSSLV